MFGFNFEAPSNLKVVLSPSSLSTSIDLSHIYQDIHSPLDYDWKRLAVKPLLQHLYLASRRT